MFNSSPVNITLVKHTKCTGNHTLRTVKKKSKRPFLQVLPIDGTPLNTPNHGCVTKNTQQSMTKIWYSPVSTVYVSIQHGNKVTY